MSYGNVEAGISLAAARGLANFDTQMFRSLSTTASWWSGGLWGEK